jgi:serine/threonine protein kinase
MEQLDHPHVVRFLGAIETVNHIHLVLEYVDSGSLASIISKYGACMCAYWLLCCELTCVCDVLGVLQEKLIAVYLKQVLEGLVYLHGNGVVHRDIKSHNLLITSTGIVKVTGGASLMVVMGAQTQTQTQTQTTSQTTKNITSQLADFGIAHLYEVAATDENGDSHSNAELDGLSTMDVDVGSPYW